MEALFDAFGQMMAAAFRISFVPWGRLFDRDRPRKTELSWTTRAAAVVVVLEVTPVLLLLFFLARLLFRVAMDDSLFIVGLIFFLPLDAFVVASGVAIAGLAALGLVGLLEGSSRVRWRTVGVSVSGVVFGAAVSLLDPPTLGYLISGFCALEVVLLTLPATAEDFGRPAPWPEAETSV